MPPVNLLIKPVSGACNLKCGYCFYCDVASKRPQRSYGSMSLDTLERVIYKTLSYAEHSCTIAFQGGEPTLRGLDFFKHSINFQNFYNKKQIKIENALQTNGYGMDDKFVQFLAENTFLTGISLDGGRETHDAYRKTPEDGGTFGAVVETVGLFKKYNADYNILSVVNNKTGRKCAKTYDFFKRHGMNFLQFIPCLDPLGETPGENAYSLTPEIYGAFLTELFDLWYEDLLKGEHPFIRQFENYISILLGYGAESCDMLGVCGRQYVVEADGGVYPCDFYVLPEFKLGDLNENTFEEIDAAREESGFIKYSAGIRDGCKKCEYYRICRGGCKRHRIVPGEGGYENYFCPSFKQFFGYALGRMAEIVNRIRSGI